MIDLRRHRENEPLFQPDESASLLYQRLCNPRKQRDRELRSFLDSLWSRYEPLAESQFIPEFKKSTGNQSRFWEMYLATKLMDLGLEVHSDDATGPDCYVVHRRQRIWIEAVSPSPGEGEDGVPKKVGLEGTGPNTVHPEEEIILRFRNSIDNKLSQYEAALSRGQAKPDDHYVIAIDGSRIWQETYETSPPTIVRSLYPFGKESFGVDKKDLTKSYISYSLRSVIEKKSGNLVTTTPFLDRKYKTISAIIYAWANLGDLPYREPHFIVVYNHRASRAISRKLFRRWDHYFFNGLNSIIRR